MRAGRKSCLSDLLDGHVERCVSLNSLERGVSDDARGGVARTC
nr:hypothetical protein [Kibdelosporangium sp. MJ126-NF4]